MYKVDIVDGTRITVELIVVRTTCRSEDAQIGIEVDKLFRSCVASDILS
jgi:hypothetical protein